MVLTIRISVADLFGGGDNTDVWQTPSHPHWQSHMGHLSIYDEARIPIMYRHMTNNRTEVKALRCHSELLSASDCIILE